MNGVRFGLFDLLRNATVRVTNQQPSYAETILISEQAIACVFHVNYPHILGATCGTLAGVVSSPFQLVKTHLQVGNEYCRSSSLPTPSAG